MQPVSNVVTVEANLRLSESGYSGWHYHHQFPSDLNVRTPSPSSKVNLTPKPPADVPLRTKCVASNKLKWWLRWFITFLTISTLIIDQ